MTSDLKSFSAHHAIAAILCLLGVVTIVYALIERSNLLLLGLGGMDLALAALFWKVFGGTGKS